MSARCSLHRPGDGVVVADLVEEQEKALAVDHLATQVFHAFDKDRSGDISIDETGEATITGFSLTGRFVSGEDHGPISILQRGNAVGTYVGTALQGSVPVNYSDGSTSDAPGVVDLQATLTTASGSFDASIAVDTVVDIGVQGFIPPEP